MESVQSVLGTLVHGEDGSSIGRLVDVLVDKAGVPREAVLDAGGFLGVGSRRIVVQWRTLHFNPDSKDQAIAISMTSDELKAAPEYKGAPHPPPAPAPAPATATPAPATATAQPAAPAEPEAASAPATSSPPPSASSNPPAPANPAPGTPAATPPSAPAPDSKPDASSR